MSFAPTPARAITAEELGTFRRDGVVCLRRILAPDGFDELADAVDDLVAGSATMADMTEMAGSLGAPRSAGGRRFVSGVDHWLDSAVFADFACRSALPAIAATLLGSTRINLYEDSVLVKEPGAVEATALHQDLSYFHVDGSQICTVWAPLDPVDVTSGAVRYLPGSHLDPALYRPNFFVSDQEIPDTEGESVPAVADDRLVSFSTGPGDVIVHHARTLHGAHPNRSTSQRRRAVSVRYCGDDARYHMRPGAPRKAHHVDALDGQPLDHPRCPVVWPATGLT